MRAPLFRPFLASVLFLSPLAGAKSAPASEFFAEPVPAFVSELWEAPKAQTSANCQLRHSELSTGEPELSISIPLLDEEMGGDSLSGKLLIPGLDYDRFKALVYGERDESWQSPEAAAAGAVPGTPSGARDEALGSSGFYSFIATATGASGKKSGRSVVFEGNHVVGGKNPRVLRRARLSILYKKNEIAITLRHTKLGAFGVWIVVYSGSCDALKRVEPSSAAAAAMAEYGRGLGPLLRALLKEPALESGVQAIRELREQVEVALTEVREAKNSAGRSQALKRFAEDRPRRVEDLQQALAREGSDPAPILGAEMKNWARLSEMMARGE